MLLVLGARATSIKLRNQARKIATKSLNLHLTNVDRAPIVSGQYITACARCRRRAAAARASDFFLNDAQTAQCHFEEIVWAAAGVFCGSQSAGNQCGALLSRAAILPLSRCARPLDFNWAPAKGLAGACH